MGDRVEQYQQDSLGNVNREIDDVRGQAGMDEDNGLATIGTADVDTEVVLMELPDDAQAAYVYQIDAYNALGTAGTFTLSEVTLDSSGNIASSTKRTIRESVGSETSRTISYTGGSFNGDAIAVTSSFEGDIGVGVYLDSREEHEPDFEQTNSLDL